MKMKLSFSMLILSFVLMACTSHPIIFPEPLKPGETFVGGAWAVENIVPQLIYRRGLTESLDFGARVGFPPVHGSGIDGTLKLMERENNIHSLNVGVTYAEQSNLSISYINSKKKLKKGSNRYKYFGLRYLYIPYGYWGSSTRFGAFWGRNYNKNWGYEFGYFHDFASETRSKTEVSPIPISFEPYTGLSIKVFFGQFIN